MRLRAMPLIILPLLFLWLASPGAAGEASKQSGDVRKDPLKRGEEVYLQVCAVCHAAGVAGAPKLGDKAAWAPHVRMGIDHLVDIAIRGKGSMPPRGGKADLSDKDVRAAVVYMVEKSR